MTQDAIISAGIRNRAARLAQIERLQPSAATARRKQEALQEIKKSLETVRTNIDVMQKHLWIPGFFPTPRHLVSEMLDAAQLRPGFHVLEPSAGKGDIAEAVRRAGCQVQCYELAPSLAEVLRQNGFDVGCCDFLELDPEHPQLSDRYDRVIMNPPFERGADVAHVKHAFRFLRPGGMLVAVVSSTAGEKLRWWDEPRGVRVEDLPAGSFARSDRPTNVNTSLVCVIHL